MSYPAGPPQQPPTWGQAHAAPAGGYPGVPSWGPPPPPPGPPEVPSTIRQAAALMWAGAGLSALGGVVGFFMKDELRDEIDRQLARQSQSANTVDPDTLLTIALIAAAVSATIGATLWIVHAIATRKGRQWARVSGSVLYAIGALSFLVGLTQPTTTISRAMSVLQQLIALGALVLIWLRPSSDFFAQSNRARRGY